MKDNNMSHLEYILISLFWNWVAYVWYRKLFFKRVFGWDGSWSVGALLALIICISILNYVISHKYDRNYKAILSTISLSFGTYTALAYFKYNKSTYLWLGVFILGCVLVCTALLSGVLTKTEAATEKEDGIIRRERNRKRRLYKGVRNIIATAGLVIIVVVFSQKYVFLNRSVQAANMRNGQLYGEEYDLINHTDMLSYLQPEKWETLKGDVEMKHKVLQAVLEDQGRRLAFNKPVALCFDSMEKGTRGYYMHWNHAIYLNTDILDEDPKEILETLCHESFHCAQRQYADLYLEMESFDQNSYFMKEAAYYAAEFRNYSDAETDYYEYYSQSVEVDARAYGIAATRVIYRLIDDWIGSTGCIVGFYNPPEPPVIMEE